MQVYGDAMPLAAQVGGSPVGDSGSAEGSDGGEVAEGAAGAAQRRSLFMRGGSIPFRGEALPDPTPGKAAAAGPAAAAAEGAEGAAPKKRRVRATAIRNTIVMPRATASPPADEGHSNALVGGPAAGGVDALTPLEAGSGDRAAQPDASAAAAGAPARRRARATALRPTSEPPPADGDTGTTQEPATNSGSAGRKLGAVAAGQPVAVARLPSAATAAPVRVSDRRPSAQQRSLLMRLARSGRLRGLDPVVLRALAPEEWLEAAREAGFDPGLDDDDGGKEAAEAHRRLYGGAGVGAEGGTGSLASAVSSVSVDGDGEWGEERLDDEFEADLRALLRPGSSSNGGSKGSAAAGGRRKGSTAAARNGSSKTHGKQAVASPAATAGLLLHHILALQTLAEAAELGLIRMLLKRAARAVDCDAGPWLRRIFKGAVKPERRLRELVAEMAGDQDAGGGSGEYDVQLQLYEYGMGSQGSLCLLPGACTAGACHCIAAPRPTGRTAAGSRGGLATRRAALWACRRSSRHPSCRGAIQPASTSAGKHLKKPEARA
eukprot:XP_001693231.1 predicted protein [Chlamydomonas reinhardtii]